MLQCTPETAYVPYTPKGTKCLRLEGVVDNYPKIGLRYPWREDCEYASGKYNVHIRSQSALTKILACCNALQKTAQITLRKDAKCLHSEGLVDDCPKIGLLFPWRKSFCLCGYASGKYNVHMRS